MATVRHRWQWRDKHNATCKKCGAHAQKRPSPYGRRWWTEWHLPDGTYTNNYNGEPTPPCTPVVVPSDDAAVPPNDQRKEAS